MGCVHVFVGPSLGPDSVARILPEAVIHPPVAHGDLLRLGLDPGDQAVLIDGVFHHAASVRHKEILDIMDRGVKVRGGASMGALRAAELAPFGMAGHGVVYRLYSLGVLDADDEVALLHDAEGDWTARTVAMVSVRLVARRLRARGGLTRQQEMLLTTTAHTMHYWRRTWPELLTRCGDVGLPPAELESVRAHIRRPPIEWDVKSQDAIRVLHAGPTAPTAPQPWPVTGYLARWRHHPEDKLSLLVTAAQLYADDYPDLHYRTVLRAIVSQETQLPRECPADLLEKHAVRVAEDRGLIPRAGGVPPHHPLAPLFAADYSAPDRNRFVARALVCTYRLHAIAEPLPLLYDAVRATPGAARLDAVLAEVSTLNDILASRGYTVDRASRSALRRFCVKRWNVRTLAPHLQDRGFASIHDLDRRGKPLCAYSCLTPPPTIALTQDE